MVFLLFMLPSLALLLVLEKYSTLHDPFELLLPHFFSIGSTLSVLGTWYLACLEVGGISKDLAQLLIKVSTRYNAVTAMVYATGRVLYLSKKTRCLENKRTSNSYSAP